MQQEVAEILSAYLYFRRDESWRFIYGEHEDHRMLLSKSHFSNKLTRNTKIYIDTGASAFVKVVQFPFAEI